MANFDAKYVISTADTVKNLQNVDAAAKSLDSTLNTLSSTGSKTASNIKLIADSMAKMVKTEREAAAAASARAKATMDAAKADAQTIANSQKLAESKSREAVNNAKAATEAAKAGAITSKAESEKQAKLDATTAAIKRQDDAAKLAANNSTRLNGARVGNTNAAGVNALAESNGRLAISEQRVQTAAAQTEAARARLNSTTDRGSRSTLELNDNLSNSRYLLYDVGATYRAISLALLTIPLATTAVATSYEKDFAQVLRTTTGQSSEAVLHLRDDLKDLGGQIPLTFGELSNIASLGAQLGLGADELTRFTEVTAKFVATTDVGVDAAATAFGRLKSAFNDQYQADPSNFFRNIGSAISELGTNSVATDSEIVAVMNQLSPLGAVAGFSAEGVAGLSSALASVRIRPELARGSFQRIMSGITGAAAEGSVAMEQFSQYMGITGQQALDLQQSDPEAFFTQFITGLGGALDSGVPFTTLLDDIGVKSVRDKQFILALANNTDVLTNSMSLASKSFSEGTYLDKSSEPVFRTLAASLKMLGTDFANLADSVGGPALQGIADFVRGFSDAANGVRDFVDANKGVGAAIAGLLAFSAFVGVLLAVKAAQAFVLAGLVAFQQVAGKTGIAAGMTMSGGLRQGAITMLMLRGASRETAGALVAQNGATRALAISSAQLVAANTAVTASLTTEAVAARAATGAQSTLGTTAAATSVAGSRMGGAFRSAGAGLLSLAGGPIGLVVIGIASIGAALIGVQQKAQAFKDSMKDVVDETGKATQNGLKQLIEGFGADADPTSGIVAALSPLTAIFNGGAIANGMISTADAAKKLGIDLSVVAQAAGGSEVALKTVNKAIDEAPEGMGYDIAAGKLKTTLGLAKEGLEENATNTKAAAKAAKDLGSESDEGSEGVKNMGNAATFTGDMSEEAAGQLDELSDAIKGAVEEAFGFVDLEAAVQSSLQALGESLAKGGNDFSVYSEAGRDNVDNLKKVFSTQAEKLGNDVTNFLITPEQAASQYGQYVNDVLGQLASKGVDTTKLAGIAEAVRSGFEQNLNSNGGVKAIVSFDPVALSNAQLYLENIGNEFGSIDVDFLAQMVGGEAVVSQVNTMQAIVTQATGQPYEFKADADTTAANHNILNTGNFLSDLIFNTWIMPVGADTNPALVALQLLQQYAAGVMNSMIDGINTVASAAKGLPGMGWAKGIGELGHVGWGQSAPAPAAAAAPKVADVRKTRAAPAQVKAAAGSGGGAVSTIPTSLAGLDEGYDKVTDAAEKAGDAGEQAGKDMANGIEDATKAVDDYASRLSTGLKSAFDKQYGLQSATDAYYSALNAITDKRKEDLKSVQDLITKQKELNNAKDADMVDARKAGIEKNISKKYGETDRAADYANQEKTALDNAAAKQKDIDANVENRKTLETGMNALTGYSNAAIANRSALRDLESKTLDMVVAYAASGKSQGEVAAYAANLTAKFGLQVGQLGFNTAAVGNLQGAMGRYVAVVNSVPQRVATAVSTSGLTSGGGSGGGGGGSAGGGGGGAIGDFGRLGGEIGNIPRKVDIGVQITYLDVLDANGALKGLREIKNGKTQHGVQLAYNRGGPVRGYADGGLIPGQAPSDPRADNLMAQVDGKGLIKVRSKEFIMSQPAVDYWGSDTMQALNAMKMPNFNRGGSVSGGSSGGSGGGIQVVELTADNLALIAQLAAKQVVLKVDGRELASTVNAGNKVLASEGRN